MSNQGQPWSLLSPWKGKGRERNAWLEISFLFPLCHTQLYCLDITYHCTLFHTRTSILSKMHYKSLSVTLIHSCIISKRYVVTSKTCTNPAQCTHPWMILQRLMLRCWTEQIFSWAFARQRQISVRRFNFEGFCQLFVTDKDPRGQNVSLKSVFAMQMFKKVSAHIHGSLPHSMHTN